jgi:hypothetical protein
MIFNKFITTPTTLGSIFSVAVGFILVLSILTPTGFTAPVQAAQDPHFKATLFGTATKTQFQGYEVVRTDSVCVPSYPACVSGASGTSFTYGGIDFKLSDTQSILLSDLKTLSTDYYALHGGVGGGSPRFIVCLSAACNGPTDFITGYLGPPPSFVEPTSTSFENNGNLVNMTSTDARWAIGNSGAYQTYSTVFATEELAYGGNAHVYDISVVIDSGWFFPASSPTYTQTVLFKDMVINNQVFFNHVSCPQQGEDKDNKQEQHEELCEEKGNQGEQENDQGEQDNEQGEQDVHNANLSGENLNNADLKGYDFSNADLSGADLSGTDLTAANLQGANLSGAILNGTNLQGANLIGANLSGTDLTGANLTDANLIGAITIGCIGCP